MIWVVFFIYGLVFAGIGFSFGLHASGRVQGKLNRILNNQQYLIRKVLQMSARMEAEIEAMRVAVEGNTSAVGSAIQLINALADMIAEEADDPDQIRALAEQVKATADALGAAVVEHTPAAPPVEPPPAE